MCELSVKKDLKIFTVVMRPNTRFVSHYYGNTVAINEWFGEWGLDLYTNVFFNINELEES